MSPRLSSNVYRPALLLLFAFGLLATGCVPISTAQQDQRYPRRPPPRVERVAVDRAVRVRVVRDAERYVRSLDRALRLDRRQERIVRDLLADRTYERVRRTRGRDIERVYPFPRRAERGPTHGWWKQTDRQIERVLDRQQRRVYRTLVRDRLDRDRRRGRHGNNGWHGRDDG